MAIAEEIGLMQAMQSYKMHQDQERAQRSMKQGQSGGKPPINRF